MLARNSLLELVAIPTCTLCGTAGVVEHSDLRDRIYSAPGTWSIRRCPNCRLGWADPQPVPSEIHKLYEGYYTHSNAEPDAQLSSLRKRLIKRLAALLLPWRRHALLSDCRYLIGRSGRLLDVGCGSGDFLAGMARHPWTCTGVEFDEDAVTIARTRGLDVRLGSVEDQHFDDAQFDAITLSNVIEHLPDPVATFAELRRILSPGGRLVMVTPNINSLGHKAFGRCWRGLEPPRHLYLFNRRTLRELAEQAGLKVEACFTTLGSSALEGSAELWGDRPSKPGIRSIAWRERLTTLFNSDEGEFVVLLANV